MYLSLDWAFEPPSATSVLRPRRCLQVSPVCQRLDLFPVEPRSREHLLGVLAQRWRAYPSDRNRGRHAKWRVQRLELTASVAHDSESPAMGELGIGHGLTDRSVGGRWNRMAVENSETGRRRAMARPLLEFIHQYAPICAPVQKDGETRVADPIRSAGRGSQSLERALAHHCQVDVAVRRRHRTENRSARRRWYFELRTLQFGECQREHALKHRHVDMLSSAEALALVERRGNGAEGVGPGDDIR